MVAFAVKIVGRIVIGLLWVRFVLTIFSVTGSALIEGIYRYSGYLIVPFQGIFRDIVIGGEWLVESTTLFAIVVYALVEFIIVYSIRATRQEDY